jgi:hypothetical protein
VTAAALVVFGLMYVIGVWHYFSAGTGARP